ncbi:MAG: chorismate mutase, partial [Deltaproteobacteria bacterium]|nr:chorismate mutase [Deltaproteobacteria bacterium]
MAEPGQSSPAAVSDAETELVDLRRRIDEVDQKILERLNDRARLVQEVGEFKKAHQTSVYAAARELEIVNRLEAANPGPFPSAGLGPVFREIISSTRSLESVLRVAYLGPEGTFSHLAASRQFGNLAELTPVPSLADVFAAVERGRADLGIVPVENTTQGVVTETLDAFAGSELTICGESLLRISQDLFSRSGRLEDVRRLASHPQPLAQCRQWLDRNLADAERVETASTAAAAQAAAEDESVAAIGSAMAGRAYELCTIEASIEDRADNTTRLLVLGTREHEARGNDLTSAVFTVRKDQAGALYRLIEPFARAGVSLTSIQQRPIQGKPWEYLFFVD